MQFAIADKHVRLQDAVCAVPGAVPSTRFLDNRLERGHVPGVDAMLDHQIARALRDQDEAVKVAEAALARAESRGSHFRSDNPSADDALAKRSFTRLRNAG